MIRVGLFAEDEGHRALLVPLLQLLARSEQVDVEVHERNATGGFPAACRELRKYVRDLARGPNPTERSWSSLLMPTAVVHSDGRARS